ncbi:MAG TPA: ABC transporter substrate-binding protein [Candidatus Limnocylindria bacterium]
MKLRSMAFAVAIAVLATACSPAASPGATGTAAANATPGEPYVVGYEAGLTGSVAADPVSRLDGLRGYFYNLNKNGGIKGHPVNVVARDDTGQDIAKATTNLTEFQTQIKPSVISGFTVSTVADAVVQYSDQYQIPFLGSAASVSALKYQYYYAISPFFAQEAEVQVGFVKSSIKAGDKPKIALFTAATPAGAAFKAEAETRIKAEGWDLVVNDPLSVPAPTDLLPQANKVMSANADWVIGTLFLTIPPALVRALSQLGFKGKVVGNGSGSGITIFQQTNNPNYYATSYLQYLGDSAPHKLITDSVKAAGGDPTGLYVSGGWATGALIAKGLAACGFPCSGASMKKALDGLGNIGNADTASAGDLVISATDRAVIHSERVFHYLNGKMEAASEPIAITTPKP